MLVTAPWPFVHLVNKSGSNGVEEHVSDHSEEMYILLNREALKATLPNVAVSLMIVMIATDVAGHPPLHECAERLRCLCL